MTRHFTVAEYGEMTNSVYTEHLVSIWTQFPLLMSCKYLKKQTSIGH